MCLSRACTRWNIKKCCARKISFDKFSSAAILLLLNIGIRYPSFSLIRKIDRWILLYIIYPVECFLLWHKILLSLYPYIPTAFRSFLVYTGLLSLTLVLSLKNVEKKNNHGYTSTFLNSGSSRVKGCFFLLFFRFCQFICGSLVLGNQIESTFTCFILFFPLFVQIS